MEPLTVALIFVAVLFALLSLGMPIAFALGLTGVSGIAVLKGFSASAFFAGDVPYSSIANFSYVMIPLFMLMGDLAGAAGVSRKAYQMGHAWLGRLPGGLAIASIAACAAFAATSGSSMATAATVGKQAIPEMERYGYDSKLAAGCVAAAGALGILIPPSIVLVLYGILANQSIGALLLAGYIPGILSAFVLMTLVVGRAILNPKIAPRGDKASWSERLRSLKGGVGVLVIIVVIMGGIYRGVFTATEAAAVGTLVTLIMLIIAQPSSWFHHLKHAVWEEAQTSGMLFALILGAGLFGLFLAMAGLPSAMAKYAVGLDLPPMVILIGILILYIPLGMFLDPSSMLIITVPIIAPVVSSLGFNLIWFGILITVMCEVANITPPVAVNCFVIHAIAPHISLGDVFRGVTPFVGAEFVIIAILIAWPQLSLWLPHTMTSR